MTALYNVLKKERRSEDLDKKEREIHEKGLVGVLRALHDELDAAVAAAYGWDAGLSEETILQRLIDLNAERRAEEEEGHIRYLRPERSKEVVSDCARRADVRKLLETLAALGHVEATDDEKYAT